MICVDEAFSTENMKTFISSFQMFVHKSLPVYLLMTGLYDNIAELENEETMTFLLCSPKVHLDALNINLIAGNYKKNLNIDDSAAFMMAKDTRGYAFAFQVLGYFAYDHTNDIDLVKNSYKQYLDEYVYDKIWSELSPKDKKILYAIAQVPSGRISEIRELLNISTNAFNPYRKRLIQKGLINGDEWGVVKFTLPLFERYIAENYY